MYCAILLCKAGLWKWPVWIWNTAVIEKNVQNCSVKTVVNVTCFFKYVQSSDGTHSSGNRKLLQNKYLLQNGHSGTVGHYFAVCKPCKINFKWNTECIFWAFKWTIYSSVFWQFRLLMMKLSFSWWRLIPLFCPTIFIWKLKFGTTTWRSLILTHLIKKFGGYRHGRNISFFANCLDYINFNSA